MSDAIELYAKLRQQTAQLLGFDPNQMTAAQVTRLDRVTTLRLLADDLQTRAVRGESIDVAKFNEVMQELERLLGGDPQQAKARDFTGARIKLENALDRLLAERTRKEAETGRCTHCGALLVRSDASDETSQQATPLDRLNLMRAAAGRDMEDVPEATAAADQEAAAAALAAASAQSPSSQPSRSPPPPPPPPQQTSPPPEPPRSDNVVSIDGAARPNAAKPPDHYLAQHQRRNEPWRSYTTTHRDRWSPPFGW